MVSKNSRKKGGDTKCPEKLQEEHQKLMESFRSLLSVEVSFLFPTMVGIQHLSRLNQIAQACLLVTFLVMGYIGTIALILSHSTDAMRWSAVVSSMTMIVTAVWLGIFHITIAFLIPEYYLKTYVPVNITLYICIVLLIGTQWKRFFRSPKCGEKMLNGNSNKKDEHTKCLENLQEQHKRLMESFRSLLSGEVSFLFPTMLGIEHLDRFGEQGRAAVLLSFLMMGYLGSIALILSHSTDAKWSAFVSFLTVVVTVYWLGVFHFSIALLSPEAHRRACILVNDFLLLCGILVIGCVWHMIFPRATS